MNAKAGEPSMNVLDLLGNQLVLDPESLAMLKQEGKVTEGEFAALMEVIGDGEVSPENLLVNLEKNAQAKTNLEALASKDVQGSDLSKNLIQKQSSEISNPLKEILLPQNATKTEQVQVAKNIAPAVVTTEKAEALVSKSPNLVNLSQFMEKQTAASQKRFQNSGGYEAPQKSMFVEKVEATNSMARTGATNPDKAVTLQDLMFAGNDEANLESGDKNTNQTLTTTTKTNTVAADPSKIFDMNQLTGNKPLSPDALITKIQDYIIQTRAGNEKSVEMSFTHKDLGQVGLQVQKHAGENIAITINTATLEGAKFFNQNQGELLQSLSTAGLQVSDFKLESSKASSNQNFSDDSSKQFAGNNKQGAQSESGERKQEQDKRQTLWEQFADQQAAA